jgi:NAD(P)-dependent dehydrogenase (short-subunit alcohol dehydrogenase family)
MGLEGWASASRLKKVALVTGGSKGIGRAFALALAESGAEVSIAARGEGALASTKSEIESLGRRFSRYPTTWRTRRTGTLGRSNDRDVRQR